MKNVKSLNEFLIKKLFFNNVFYKQKELIKEIFKQFYENKWIFYWIFINKIIKLKEKKNYIFSLTI